MPALKNPEQERRRVEALSEARRKAILGWPLDGGDPIWYESGRAYARATGMASRAVSVCLAIQQRRPSCGFWWEFEGDPMRRYPPDGVRRLGGLQPAIPNPYVGARSRVFVEA